MYCTCTHVAMFVAYVRTYMHVLYCTRVVMILSYTARMYVRTVHAYAVLHGASVHLYSKLQGSDSERNEG